MDGALWTSHDFSPVPKLYDVCFGNGSFVAVGPLGATLATADGVNWRMPIAITGRGLNGVAFGQDKFVAVGDNGTMLISPADFRPALKELSLDFRGQFGFELSAAEGDDLTIQISTNLTDWDEFGRIGLGIPERIVDPESLKQPVRFYRVIRR